MNLKQKSLTFVKGIFDCEEVIEDEGSDVYIFVNSSNFSVFDKFISDNNFQHCNTVISSIFEFKIPDVVYSKHKVSIIPCDDIEPGNCLYLAFNLEGVKNGQKK